MNTLESSPHPTVIACRDTQRGAANFVVVLLLLAAALLATFYTHRDALFAQRMAVNQQRASLASEAAEAGLEWALAELNDSSRIGPDCQAAAGAPNRFLERYLRHDPATSRFTPTTWDDAGSATPLQPSCLHEQTGWSCTCPASGRTTPTMPSNHALVPAFSLQFAPADRPGLIRVIATGCTTHDGGCSAATGVDGIARIEALFGLVPALRNVPAAPLVTLGSVDAGNAAIGIHHPNPATGGVAIQAGGRIETPMARITPPAGSPIASALVDHDEALAGLGADGLFAALFGLDKASWKQQALVTPLDCRGSCGAQLAAAIGDGGKRLIRIDGDVRVDGPVTLGSSTQPVVIVVDGTLAFSGAVKVFGIVHARRITWAGSPGPGALVRGALVSETGYSGNAEPDLFHDVAVFAALKSPLGSFARVPGSWRDF